MPKDQNKVAEAPAPDKKIKKKIRNYGISCVVAGVISIVLDVISLRDTIELSFFQMLIILALFSYNVIVIIMGIKILSVSITPKNLKIFSFFPIIFSSLMLTLKVGGGFYSSLNAITAFYAIRYIVEWKTPYGKIFKDNE